MGNRHLLVTGASRGIGYETVRKLAGDGHFVTAVARSQSRLDKLQSYRKDRITITSMDLSQPDAARKLADSIRTSGRQLDGMLNNAGKLVNKPFTTLGDQDWVEMIEINLMVPVRLCRELVDTLNPGSHIVNIGSMGGFQQSKKFPGLAGYSTTKGALAILSECLAVELNDRQISVNCLCPGAVDTEMFQAAFPGQHAPVNPVEMGKYLSQFLLEGHKFYNGKVLPVSLSDPD